MIDTTIVISNGNSSIGRELARQFFSHGANILIIGQDAQRLANVAREIDPNDLKVIPYIGDVNDQATVKSIIIEIEQQFGSIDILVNSSSITEPKPSLEFEDVGDEYFLKHVVPGPMFLAKAFADSMKKSGGGMIIHTGSAWALEAIKPVSASSCLSAVVCAREALDNLTVDLAHNNIRIDSVPPLQGGTSVNIFNLAEGKKALSSFLPPSQPISRNGRQISIVEAIQYLVSENASCFTGAFIPVGDHADIDCQ